MKANVGTIDRIVRAVLGLVLIGLAASGIVPGVWMWVAGVVGVVLLVTAAISFCPIWMALGVNTCPVKKA